MTISNATKTALSVLVATTLPFVLLIFYHTVINIPEYSAGLVPEFPGAFFIRIAVLFVFYFVPTIILFAFMPVPIWLRTFGAIAVCGVLVPVITWFLFMIPCVEHDQCL